MSQGLLLPYGLADIPPGNKVNHLMAFQAVCLVLRCIRQIPFGASVLLCSLHPVPFHGSFAFCAVFAFRFPFFAVSFYFVSYCVFPFFAIPFYFISNYSFPFLRRYPEHPLIILRNVPDTFNCPEIAAIQNTPHQYTAALRGIPKLVHMRLLRQPLQEGCVNLLDFRINQGSVFRKKSHRRADLLRQGGKQGFGIILPNGKNVPVVRKKLIPCIHHNGNIRIAQHGRLNREFIILILRQGKFRLPRQAALHGIIQQQIP